MKMLYLPKGTHQICAGFSGPASHNQFVTIEMFVRVKKSAVKALEKSLLEHKSEQPHSGAFVDADGREDKSCGWNPRFEWSQLGVELIFDQTPDANFTGKYIGANFTTDANYKRVKIKGDKMKFRRGLRGSKSNPAEVTGCDFCVGSLTANPAFRKLIS